MEGLSVPAWVAPGVAGCSAGTGQQRGPAGRVVLGSVKSEDFCIK